MLNQDNMLFGQLNQEIELLEYIGKETDTANVIIDDGTLAVDVKKVPHQLTITEDSTGESLTHEFDGSSDTAVDLSGYVNESELDKKIEKTTQDIQEKLDAKVDKITVASGNPTRVYGADSNGETSIPVDKSALADAIAWRNANANLVGNDATANNEYTPLAQVEQFLAKKADIIPRPADGTFVYGKSSTDATDQPKAIPTGTGNMNKFSVVMRTDNGQINLPNQSTFAPTANQAINRLYADSRYLGKTGGTITGGLVIGGNLTVNGTTTTVESTTLQVKDKLIEVAHGNTEPLTTPAGIVAPNYNGKDSGAMVFDNTGTAYVGDVILNEDGNIDVEKSQLQPLATRHLTPEDDLNLVRWDETNKTLVGTGASLMGGDDNAERAIQQPKKQYIFFNTLVGYTKNDPDGSTVGKDAYGAYIDPVIYGDQNETDTKNSGVYSTMLGGLSHNAGATPSTVRPDYTGDASQSFIAGRRNINIGKHNAIFNTDNIAYGDDLFISGLRNIAIENEVTMLGTGLIANKLGQVVIGRYNEADDSKVLILGGGRQNQHSDPDETNPDGSKKYILDSITRRNLLTVDGYGNTYAYGKMSARLAPTNGIDVVRLTDMNTALSGKLDKLDPDTKSLLYGVTPEGRNTGFATGTANIDKFAIPQRMDKGQIKLPTQTGTSNTPEDDQAISAGYTKILIGEEKARATGAENALGTRVTNNATAITNEVNRAQGEEEKLQTAIDKKLDKITAPHIGEVVYSQKADGTESSITVSGDSVKNSLPLRDDDCKINANIDCGKPNDRPDTLPSYGSANYLQLLRGTPEEWGTYDAPLMDGEVALLKWQNGRVQLRVGNGQNKFSTLKNVGDITVKSGALSYGTLEAGVEYRITTIEEGLVEYYFPDTPDEDLYSILVFDAPATAIEFATDEDAKLTGDNCKNGMFTPAPNTHYTVYFWYDGTKQGFVRGVPTDSGTWVSDKPTIGTSTSSTDLKKIVYTADADIPTTPEEGVEYACTDLIGEGDLAPSFVNKVNSKQNLLTFDTAPTSGSTNPVTSGGIYDAISKFLTIQVSDSLIGG